jgi:hypothetical protein
MKILGWYSKIIIVWTMISFLYEIMVTRGAGVEIAFWAFMMFAPVSIYIVKTKENK